MPKYLTPDAQDLLTRLLEKSPAKRIGCGKEGPDELKRHPFFKNINWEKLLAKEIEPPYVPEVMSDRDTSNVDEEFLQEAPRETPVIENEMTKLRGKSELFDNFSFVNERSLQTTNSSNDEQSSQRKRSFEDCYDGEQSGSQA